MKIIYFLEDFNEISIAVRLICAAVMGALIGMERATSHQAAGLRTFSLVCIGSALAQIIDIRCVMQMGMGDPVRLSQGVISGIGFLGVGTIIVTRENHIKGLTTAATLWATAVLGICVGSGYITGSVLAFILIIVVVKSLAYVSRHLEQYTREIDLIIDIDNHDAAGRLTEYMREHGYRIKRMERTEYKGYVRINMEIDLGSKMNHQTVIDEIYRIKNINYVQENR